MTITDETAADTTGPIHHLPHDGRLGWPLNCVPVEIFNLVIGYLSRRDIQSMRLVNHEFDAKLAEIYFKVVVVPFRPEFEALYGSLNINPGQRGDQQKLSLVIRKKGEDTNLADDHSQDHSHTSIQDESLLSAGHRVFQQFGDKMRKFALALELNEKDLAYPPMKLNQEIVSAPWGLYRWPIMNYQRYTQLEGLEQMADETGYMKKAFQFLEDVTEIGISCDAGLGWLHGPDTNPLCTRHGPAVFRETAYEDAARGNEATTGEDEQASLSLSILRQMVLNAGYSAREWPRVVLRLLQDEGREGAIVWADRIAPDGKVVHERVPKLRIDDKTTKEAILEHIESVIERDSDGAVTSATDARTFGLIPSNLTTAQAEMLLELEWAHRALMQSYRIAVMDNKSFFKNLRKLTIARCPGCHVLTWCDDSFWETMTSIETFHLGVIPDWREITKDPSGVVNQRRIVPTNACQNVFKLLNQFVGEQQNIKNFSFEWVCGGEFAVGKSQRDRYILPAPLLSDAIKMVDVQHAFTEDDILNMPYVQKLALKNCWLTPHVFLNFFKHMFKEGLIETSFETVSLTGPPSMAAEPSIYPSAPPKPTNWPWPLCVGAEPGNWFQLQRPNPNGINNANPGILPWQVAGAMGQNVPPPPIPQTFTIGPNWGVNAGPNPGLLQPALQPAAPAALGQNQNGSPVPVNHPMAPAQQNNLSSHAHRWRAWSWPHVLASLGMASAAVNQLLKDSSEADNTHWQTIRRAEHRFDPKFEKVFEDRDDRSNRQTFTFKSCGYALVEAPSIDNWKIIPDHAIHVQHSADLPARLRELDNQMLVSQEGLLAKVMNYMPDEEERQLRNIFGFQFGWQNLYDPIVAQIAIMDGNPQPGRARFHGSVDNDPDSVSEKERSKLKGKVAGTHIF